MTYAPGFSFFRIGKIRREYGIEKNGMFEAPDRRSTNNEDPLPDRMDGSSGRKLTYPPGP